VDSPFPARSILDELPPLALAAFSRTITIDPGIVFNLAVEQNG